MALNNANHEKYASANDKMAADAIEAVRVHKASLIPFH